MNSPGPSNGLIHDQSGMNIQDYLPFVEYHSEKSKHDHYGGDILKPFLAAAAHSEHCPRIELSP
jgi:hypothetical protein